MLKATSLQYESSIFASMVLLRISSVCASHMPTGVNSCCISRNGDDGGDGDLGSRVDGVLGRLSREEPELDLANKFRRGVELMTRSAQSFLGNDKAILDVNFSCAVGCIS